MSRDRVMREKNGPKVLVRLSYLNSDLELEKKE